MTKFTTEVYKEEQDGSIGARVIVYDDNKNPINEISIVNEEDLDKIKELLATHTHDERYYTKDEINNFHSESIKIVTELPEVGNTTTLYFVKYKTVYKMYIWVDGLGMYSEIDNTDSDYIRGEIRNLQPILSLDETGDLYIEYL